METAIRVGKISSVDYAAGTARVAYPDRDNEVTSPMPMLSGEYNPPGIGDQVVTLHLSNGGGVILGRVWSNINKPPEGAEGIYRKDLGRISGEAVIRYDGSALSIKCTGSVSIEGSIVTVNGMRIGG